VVFDVLGRERLLSRPRNLYDAWVRSIVAPLVEVARNDTEIFKLKHLEKYPGVKLLEVPFEIPDGHWPYVLDWSYSNAEALYEYGYACAKKFYEEGKHEDPKDPKDIRNVSDILRSERTAAAAGRAA
jgi:NTE family protein